MCSGWYYHPFLEGMKRPDDFGNIKQWTWNKAGTTTTKRTGWQKALQLLTATILHLNHKIVLPGWHVSKYFLEWKHNVNRVELAEKAKKGNCCFLGYYMETPHFHRKYFSKKSYSMKKWSHQIRQIWLKKDRGAWPWLLGRSGGIQECSRYPGQWGFATQRCVPGCCPRQEAAKDLGYRSGTGPRPVTPWDLYKHRRGHNQGERKWKLTPETISREKTSLNCSSSWKSKCGRRNKAQNNKTHEASMARAK